MLRRLQEELAATVIDAERSRRTMVRAALLAIVAAGAGVVRLAMGVTDPELGHVLVAVLALGVVASAALVVALRERRALGRLRRKAGTLEQMVRERLP